MPQRRHVTWLLLTRTARQAEHEESCADMSLMRICWNAYWQISERFGSQVGSERLMRILMSLVYC